MSEIELKFVLDERTTSELWARVKALKLASGSPKTRTLRSIYLDTPEHALKKAGIALRLRRDGRRWIQTVKTEAELHGGLSQVGEVENPAPGGRLCLEAIPDASVRDEIIRRVNGAALQPVCETVMKRSASELSLEDGTRAELAVDVGEIRAEGRSAELREVEIELIEGSPGGLFDIAHALFPDGGLRFSRLSKAARGYLLAERGELTCRSRPETPRRLRSIRRRRRAGGTRYPARMPGSDRHEHRSGQEAGRPGGPAPVAGWPAPPAQRVLCLRFGAEEPGDGEA